MKETIAGSIELKFEIEASSKRIFAALTEEIGAWWTHRFKDGGRVVLEPRPGGRFYEDWGEGSGALYATVTYIDPPVELRLVGPMGMAGAVVGSMVFAIAETGGFTRLTLTHAILGSVDRETVEAYRSGWKELIGSSLKAHVEGKGHS
jgi:uncharacterized protein YndB with AHSA1/START domain